MEVVAISNLEMVMMSDGHVELVDGQVVVQDRTTTTHNIAVTEISTALMNYISSHGGTCKVFTENVALFVNEMEQGDNEYYLPDVMVVCDKDSIHEDGVHSVPLFVAEVTSDSTKVNDYGHKKEIYRKIGVKEYWIVDVQRKIIMKHLLYDGYIPNPHMHPLSMAVSVFPEINIDVSAFMRG